VRKTVSCVSVQEGAKRSRADSDPQKSKSANAVNVNTSVDTKKIANTDTLSSQAVDSATAAPVQKWAEKDASTKSPRKVRGSVSDSVVTPTKSKRLGSSVNARKAVSETAASVGSTTHSPKRLKRNVSPTKMRHVADSDPLDKTSAKVKDVCNMSDGLDQTRNKAVRGSVKDKEEKSGEDMDIENDNPSGSSSRPKNTNLECEVSATPTKASDSMESVIETDSNGTPIKHTEYSANAKETNTPLKTSKNSKNTPSKTKKRNNAALVGGGENGSEASPSGKITAGDEESKDEEGLTQEEKDHRLALRLQRQFELADKFHLHTVRFKGTQDEYSLRRTRHASQN
jgi:hypothetical protein